MVVGIVSTNWCKTINQFDKVGINPYDKYMSDLRNSFKKIKTEKKRAFTLAEVLITLGIIGVVAALTIPILNNEIQDQQHKTAYKKAFADASNIWSSMASNYEVIPCPDLASITGDICTYPNFDTFKSYMKISKDCGTAVVTSCWNITGESLYEVQGGGSGVPGKPSGGGARGFIDESGRSWLMAAGSFTYDILLAVDTNGFKPPNKFGKDRATFWAVLPNGNGVWVTSNPYPGTAVKIAPSPDRSAINLDCGYPPCKGKSWLYD